MLNAKKLGHSIYSFSRKGELFKKINKSCNINVNINGKIIENKLKRMIITKNLLKFSLYFENTNEKELIFISSIKHILLDMLDQNEWKKGKNVFEKYVR